MLLCGDADNNNTCSILHILFVVIVPNGRRERKMLHLSSGFSSQLVA